MAEKTSKQKTTAKTQPSKKPAVSTAGAAKSSSKDTKKTTNAQQAKSNTATTKSSSAAPKSSAAKSAEAKSSAVKVASTEKGSDKAAVKPKTSKAAKTAGKQEAAKVSSKQTAPAKEVKPKKNSKSDKKSEGGFFQKFKSVFGINAKDEGKTKVAAMSDAEANGKKQSSGSKKQSAVVLALQNKKIRIITIAVASALVLFFLILGIVLGIRGKGRFVPYYEVGIGAETFYDEDEIVTYSYDTNYTSTALVGFYAEQIGTVERNIPDSTRDEGLASGYPKFGYTLSGVLGSGKESLRNALIQESNYLCATGTSNASGGGGGWTWMDKDGFLYSGSTADPVPTKDKFGQHRRLYKHTGAVGLYLGDVSDSEPGIIKRITMRPRGYNGYGVTGIYAPAGEVIKIQISEADMNATGGITIHIGQALYNGQANNIWTAKNQMNRMPVILNTMTVNKNTATYEDGVYTAYVGSFLGGPLYIRNTGATFTATISGGVAYSHFILGYTSKEEFEKNAQSSAPYFDLEVWSYGVLHSGPKNYAKAFNYDAIYKVAVFWEKVASVTTTNSNQGIVFIYDSFVAAGAAVAFPGRRSVNCPMGWMSGALNYNGLVNSGSWGNFHEYHHNFQGFGVGDGGEVTNNAMTLVSYALFTKISANRGIGSYGVAGLGGWNRYTSATWALYDVMLPNPSNGRKGLSLYATLLHNFGADNFIQTKVKQMSSGYGQSYFGYLKAWEDITHNDMTYYFNDILGAGITDEMLSQYAGHSSDYPLFVPVSSVYQTGRSYKYNGETRYIETMQPYVINAGDPFTVDLRRYSAPSGMYESGSIVLPEGFECTIKNVSNPEHGTLTATDTAGVYTYTPDDGSATSGKIYVTIGITKTDDPSKVIDDVDLVLEFQTTREKNKNMLERTVYTYTQDTVYTDAVEAFNHNYAGYANVTTGNNVNKVQNCNSDIWFTQQNGDMMPENSVVELKGKIYVDETAKYRIAIRGRWNVALFVSFDGGENYELAAKYVQTNTNDYVFSTIPETYKDYELESGTWVHFKAVLITQMKGSTACFIGVGWGRFTPEAGVYDEEGELVGYSPETVSVGYASAYRDNYQFSTSAFETDYFYTRKYNYTYIGTPVILTKENPQTYVSELSNYIPWDADQVIGNLFDGKTDTGIHFSSNWGVSATKPAILTFDMGKEVTANSLVLYLYKVNQFGDRAFPRIFTLEVSSDGETFTQAGSWSGVAAPAASKEFTFDADYTFRYYRLTITGSTGTNNNNRIALGGLELRYTFRLPGTGNNDITPDHEMFTYAGEWEGRQAPSTFGHIYLGKANATMSFTFTGTRMGIISSNAFGKAYEVYIDGRKEASITVKEDNGFYAVSYISPELAAGSHNVVIKCVGEGNIDSILIY